MRIKITVLLLLFALSALLAGPAGAQTSAATPSPTPSAEQTPADEPSADAAGRERVVDLTFPLPVWDGYVDTYDSPRSGGRLHRATDILADKLVTVHAAVGGEVCYAPGLDDAEPSYGYMLRICGDDGLRYAYIHLNNDTPGTDDGAGGPEWAYAPGIIEGARVERGDWIGFVGDSGNAEGGSPHLHFEIFDAEAEDSSYLGRINPFFSLRDAEDREDLPVAPADAAELVIAAGTSTSARDGAAATDGTGSTAEASAVARIAGDNRIDTAVALSQESHGSADTVIVVPADSPFEAMLAAPLAGKVDGPVLLSGSDQLPDAVNHEIQRLGARNAYLIGTPAQLPDAVVAGLSAAGIQNQARLAADDPPALSVVVARELASLLDGAAPTQVLLARAGSDDPSRAWPDALSASALAAHQVVPILLSDTAALSDGVAQYLTEAQPRTITVVGGQAAVSEDVAHAAVAAAGATGHPRLAGPDRYATSAAVAGAARAAGLDADAVWLATGRNFPDALAAGPAASLAGSPLVLVDGADPGGAAASVDWLAANASVVTVVGGRGAVADAVAEAVVAAIGGS